MKRIEVVTWDFGTGKLVVDKSWDVAGCDGLVCSLMLQAAKRTAKVFAEADHSTDHVVYARTV